MLFVVRPFWGRSSEAKSLALQVVKQTFLSVLLCQTGMFELPKTFQVLLNYTGNMKGCKDIFIKGGVNPPGRLNAGIEQCSVPVIF